MWKLDQFWLIPNVLAERQRDVSRDFRLMEKRFGAASSACFILTREVLCGS